MANNEAIQVYLQRHKIGMLFEDLMSKLINDQPDEPLAYLSGVLHLRAEKKGQKSHLRKSMSDMENIAVAKDRSSYEKPWQTNSRRSRPKELDTKVVRRSMPSKPEWDATNKSPTDFDDFWEQGRKSPSKKRAGSPSKGAASQWADSYAQDEDLLYHSYGYRGPQREEAVDPLAGEFSLAKVKSSKSQSQPVNNVNHKVKGRKHDSLAHKQQLQKMVLEKQPARDSGYEEEKDIDEDNAIELMEDLEDLRREGAGKTKNKSGIRISNSSRAASRSSPPQVKVGICARCATVMSGGMPSDKAENYGQLPEFDEDSDVASARAQSSRFSPGPFATDDEEFESVSQVTGPRRPIWQESDQEALTPRKGAHMFASNMSPSKGYPMYSTDRPMTSEGRSSSPKQRQEPLRQTWAPDVASSSESAAAAAVPAAQTSPSQEPPETSRTDATEDEDFPKGGEGWNVHADGTDMSSVYGAPVKGQKNRGSYQGAF